MTDDPVAAISAALTEADSVTPLTILGQVADWAQSVLSQVGDDEDAALEYVIALYDALPRVTRLTDHLPALVKAASPGAEVSERLAEARSRLDSQQAALAAERARIEEARDLEARAREVAAERDGLAERIERLERARRVERELPALRARKDELEAAVCSASVAEGNEVLSGLREAAMALRALSEEQRSLLAEENGQMVSAVTAAVQAVQDERDRRDELAAELDRREQEAGQLRAERERELPGLRARRQADEELLAGIAAAGLLAGASAAERVRVELSEIEQRIENAEGILKPLFRRHALAYEEARKTRGLND